MILFTIFFIVLGTVLAEENILCTSDFCKDVKCADLPEKCIVQNATYNGVLLPSPSSCNCCQYCIEHLLEGEECSTGDVTVSNPTEMCGPGLYCKNTDDTGTDGFCSRMNTACTLRQDDYDERRSNGTLGTMEVRQVCDGEGEFVPYNCIPDQSCYCVNSTGFRIFGESDFTSFPDADLHCKCSRDYLQVSTLIDRELRPGEFFHCASNGAYEPVQCIDDQCFCVDTADGAPTYPNDPPVNLTDLSKDTLKCYKKEEIGDFYKKCETEYLELLKEYESFQKDGYRMLIGYDFPKCDLDGTYQAVQENTTHKFCVDKEGTVLTTVDKTNTTAANSMNCKCIRASLLMTTNEKPTCDDTGNYSKIQCRRGKCRCVDLDGNQICRSKTCEVNEGENLNCPTK